MMGRSFLASGIAGALGGIVPGVLSGIATNFIVLRMRRSKTGAWGNAGFVTALGGIGAMGFSVWRPVAAYVDTDAFLPSFF